MIGKGFSGYSSFYNSLANTNTRSTFAGNLLRILDSCTDLEEKILISEYDDFGLFKALCEIEDGKLLNQYLSSLDNTLKKQMFEKEAVNEFEAATRKKFYDVCEIIWKNAVDLGCEDLLIAPNPNEFLLWTQEANEINAFEKGLIYCIKNKFQITRLKLNLNSENPSRFDEQAYELMYEFLDNPQDQFETLQERLSASSTLYNYTDQKLMDRLKFGRSELRKIGLTSFELYNFLETITPIKRILLSKSDHQVSTILDLFENRIDAVFLVIKNYFSNLKSSETTLVILDCLSTFSPKETSNLRIRTELMHLIATRLTSNSCDQTTSSQEQVCQVQRA